MEGKKPKYGDRDCLMDLPEGILLHILSYLPMKDVIKTSLVAKRWRYVWLYVPRLNFPSLVMPAVKKIAFINRALVLHKASEIQKFSISLTKKRLHTSEAYDVQSWILFAVTRNVKELYLGFCGFDVVLPRCVFTCGSLTVLELHNCVINNPVEFKLTSLRSLTFKSISCGWEHANAILSSSPNVERLSLVDCFGKTSEKAELFIMNAGMKTLHIEEGISSSEKPDIKVYAPFVVSFDLFISTRERNVVLTRMKYLESVTLGFSKCDARKVVFKILYNICRVKALRLSRSCLEVTIPDRGHLKLKNQDFIVVLQNLETVEICHFMRDLRLIKGSKTTAKEDDVSFLEFLLENSKALKKMTIKIFEHLRINESKMTKLQLLLKEKLLAAPKASGGAADDIIVIC